MMNVPNNFVEIDHISFNNRLPVNELTVINEVTNTATPGNLQEL